MIAPATNLLGYFYYNIGDKEKSKSLFEEYLELYPNGYNSYDSMGEFYYNEGDFESAKDYYGKAVENFFAASSANGKLRELNQN